MTPSAFDELCERARREVDERLPACQLAVARGGELLGFETFSRTGAETNDTRFVVWSCTKGVVAGVVWQLMGEGLVDVEHTVASYIPEFANNGKDAVTVEQVLLHTAGFPSAPMNPTRRSTSAGRRDTFARWRLNWEPGTRYEYHPTSAWWVLAELITAVTGEDHRDAVRTRVCEPLGLRRLQLGVPEADQGDIAEPVAVAATDGSPSSAVAAFLVAAMDPAARASGIPGGGAVSTAADVAMYYQALLHNDGGLWSSDVLADVTGVIRNTFPDIPKRGMPANRSRGIVIRGDHELAHWMMHFGPGTSPRTFGHDGAGGMIAWADPESGLSFCFLTNGMEADGRREAQRCQDFARLAAACG